MRDAAQQPGGPEAGHGTASDDAVEQRLRYQQTLHAAGHLVGGVAHDFNNMLGAIKGFTALLESQLEPGSGAAAILDEIRAAVSQSCQLNRQLLAFSRKQMLQAERMDLNAVVRAAEPTLRPLLGSRIELAFELDAELAPVRIDAAQIEQVLVNLALNARDAMAGAGRLAVSTRNYVLQEREPHADGFVIPPGRYARLCVADTGCGMNDATRVRAFEPFFTSRRGDSVAGLGLSTVFGIVKQLGGYVWLESEVGAGTALHVCLPEAAPAAASAAATTIPPAAAQGAVGPRKDARSNRLTA